MGHAVRRCVGFPPDVPIRVLRRRRPRGGGRLHPTAVVLRTDFTRDDVMRLTPARRGPKCQRRSILGDRKEPFAFAQGDGGRPRVRYVIKLLSIRKEPVPGARALTAPMNPLRRPRKSRACPSRAAHPQEALRRIRSRIMGLLIRRNPRVSIHLVREIARRPEGLAGCVPMLRLQRRRTGRRGYPGANIRAARIQCRLRKLVDNLPHIGRLEMVEPAQAADGATVMG